MRTSILAGLGLWAGLGLAAMAAEPVSAPDPVYPAAATAAGVEGVVVVLLSVAPSGAVADAKIVSETPPGYGFGAAALDSARAWRFEPGAFGSYQVQLNFTLADAPAGNAARESDSAAERATGLPSAPPPLARAKITYPESARFRGIDGAAVLIVTIDDDGAVADCEIFSERPVARNFGIAAKRSVVKWRFPKGVAGTYALTINFGVRKEDDTHKEGRWRMSRLRAAPDPVEAGPVPIPKKAYDAGIAGVVSLAVSIEGGGAVGGTNLMVETPQGYGFARLAAETVKTWRFPPETEPGTYGLTVRFDPPAR